LLAHHHHAVEIELLTAVEAQPLTHPFLAEFSKESSALQSRLPNTLTSRRFLEFVDINNLLLEEDAVDVRNSQGYVL